MGNKSLERDDRERLPYWGEEKEASVLSGTRTGEFLPDTNVVHSGKSSARVTSSGDWFAISSVNYPLAAWVDRYEISAWARSEGAASVQILACWTDDMQIPVRIDAGPSIQVANWQLLSLTLAPPTNAAALRVVLAARGGRAWFDDAELLRLPARDQRLRIFVNQIAYEQRGPKTAVVACNLVPTNLPLRFQVLASNDKVIFDQPLASPKRIHAGTADDWGWYFWRADFTSLQEPGRFRARAEIGGTRVDSASFVIGPGALLQETAQNAVDFFFIQRCGFDVPGWHKACHLDDAKLPDGRHIEATGGWHSAGDYNKLMYEHGDGGVVFAMLKAFRTAPDIFKRYDRNQDGFPDILDEASWGAQFVIKMQIPETGGLRNHIHQGPERNWMKWSAPEVHTDNLPGTADDPVIQAGEGNSPLVIGGWARLSEYLKQQGRTSHYLEAALRLWNYTTKDKPSSGSAHLLLSALELHAVTHQSEYLERAQAIAERLLSEQAKTGRLQGAFGTFGEITAGALAAFVLAAPEHPLNSKITPALKDYTDFCIRQAENPFGLSQQPAGEAARFFPPDMGNSFQVLARAWAGALIYRVTGERRALVFAQDHLDWLLGKNPLGLCLFEGKGAANPPRYHHRYNQIPGHERGAVPGTVPNGFVHEMGLADRAGIDLSRGGSRSPSYRTSEPWLVHNLYFLLAASEMHTAVAR